MSIRSLAFDSTGPGGFHQFFNMEAGGGAGAPVSTPSNAPAPAAPPFAPVAPATPDQTPPTFHGGLRLPTGENPLLAQPAPAPAPVAAPAVTPQATPGIPGTPQAPQPTPAPAPAPQVYDFGGRRVSAEDAAKPEVLSALHQDYRNLQGQMTRAQQQLAQVRQQQTAAAPAPAPMQTGQPGAQAAPPAQAVDLKAAIQAAVGKLNADEFQNQMYENPSSAFGSLLEQTLAPVVSGLQQQFQAQLQQQTAQANQYVMERQTEAGFSSELEQMAAAPDQYPGLQEAYPIMEQVLTEHPYLFQSPQPMVAAYLMARGYAGGQSQANQTPAAQPQPITVDTVMSDQNLMGQIMQHPQIRDQIVRSYLEALRSGQPPVILGAPSGGTPPATPPNKPANIRQAGMMARQFLGLGQQ